MPILLVEDDADLRELLAESLVERGFLVTVANSAEEALQRLHARPVPRVVLIDLMLPGLSVETFLDAKRSDHALALIPVFVVSGRPDGKEIAGRLGVQGFFSKPLDMERLVTALCAIRPSPA